MGRLRRTTTLTSVFIAFTLLLSACTNVHVWFLANDALGGRVPGSAGHGTAQTYLVNYLVQQGAEALDGTTDPAAFRADYATGTNVVARIPGTDLADEIVLVSAHYDHLASCSYQGGSSVCNGATDNAAGVAIALEIAAALDDAPVAPRRTVMFGFWDEEERGLIGSRAWIDDNPAIVDNIVAYVNYDIQGANLLPSLVNDTLAVGAESGGAALENAVAAAGGASTLDLTTLSLVFGQGRSDHASFFNASVPGVFFSDATGSCYHTSQDTYDGALNQDKLEQQLGIGVALVTDLAAGTSTPTFDGTSPLATYADAVAVHGLIESLLPDVALFTATQQATLLDREATLQTMVDNGAAGFDSAAQTTLLFASLDLVDILASGTCDGFLGS
jgi:Peptidase family M28